MSIFAGLNVYHDIVPRSAAMNMAIDQALLESAAAPSIRFYRWESPALSFGYFGRFADVADKVSERDLVRRWTGGGIVFHGEDLTYSVVIPVNDPVFAESPMSIYENVHRALGKALLEAGQRATVAGVDDPGSVAVVADVGASGYNCFANPVRADVIIDGRKVAGAAQRRTRAGLLQQGSVQYVDVENGLAERFAQALSANCNERKIADEVLNRACELARQKYETDAWLRRR
jgi:lipoyl(octanoyl) transferase